MSVSTAQPVATLGNTHETYGGVAKAFHWATALLILTAIPLGVVAYNLPYETSEQLARKAWLFSLHKTVGIAAFFVALARILWALSQPKPGLLNAEKKLESFAAETVHWLLYASLVLVPLSGWLHHASSEGFAPIWWPFGQSLPLVPKNAELSAFFAGWHWVFTKVLGAAILFHIAGALKHHVIDRDATLRRMLPGRVAVSLPAQHESRAPVLAAVGVWAAAVALGSVLGLSDRKGAIAAPTATLKQAPSEWAVTDGTLAITVQQLGSPVQGQFGDWTAAIDFDPESTEEVMGSVEVTIAIGTLSLGSVTSDALNAEFLDASTHPTATFAADIRRAAEGAERGYVADGTLSLKGQSVPVQLPFDLTLEGDTAQMTGGLTLDRRNYNVGTSKYPDEKSVGFSVDVNVNLTAKRGGDAEAMPQG